MKFTTAITLALFLTTGNASFVQQKLQSLTELAGEDANPDAEVKKEFEQDKKDVPDLDPKNYKDCPQGACVDKLVDQVEIINFVFNQVNDDNNGDSQSYDYYYYDSARDVCKNVYDTSGKCETNMQYVDNPTESSCSFVSMQ